MPSSSPPEYVTIAQVMEQWNVTRQTVMNWLSAGLPSTMFEGKRWMRREDVKTHFAAILTTAPNVKTRRKNRNQKE